MPDALPDAMLPIYMGLGQALGVYWPVASHGYVNLLQMSSTQTMLCIQVKSGHIG